MSEEYSGIPNEMKEAAKVLGVELLCETNLDSLLAHVNEIPNDRAVLRAIHFFEENRRVDEMAAAIGKEDIDTVLKLVKESGTSSWELLQNCYSLQDCKEQKITRTLALTDLFFKGNRRWCMPCARRRLCGRDHVSGAACGGGQLCALHSAVRRGEQCISNEYQGSRGSQNLTSLRSFMG